MARVKSIHMDDEGNPITLVVELSVAEAAYIAKFTGAQTSSDEVINSLYDNITGGFFNRFWDAGVDGFLSGRETS